VTFVKGQGVGKINREEVSSRISEVDIEKLSRLVKARGLDEESKPENREKIAGRIQLLNDVIHRGLAELLDEATDHKNN
jgi:hypothetical protein